MAAALSASLGATVAGLDASEALLEIARERTPGGDFRRGDLQALPFEDDSFDLVTGFNSFQYAGNAAQALREAGRVTRPGGWVVIMTWGEPGGMEAAGHVAAPTPLMPPPPPGAGGPFPLSDETALREFAEAAGLTPVEVRDVDTPWHYPDLTTALRGMASSGVAVRAAQHSGEDALMAALEGFLKPFERQHGTIASARGPSIWSRRSGRHDPHDQSCGSCGSTSPEAAAPPSGPVYCACHATMPQVHFRHVAGMISQLQRMSAVRRPK